MGTVTRRRPADRFLKDARIYLTARAEEAAAKRLKDSVSSDIKSILEEKGVLDETTGHREILFKEPVAVGSKTIVGLRRQRNGGTPYLDEEKAEEILREKGLWKKASVVVETLDHDAVYVLHQQGDLSEEEIDAMMTESVPTYSLNVIEG